ncbi:hypothetical protein MTR67_039275 [Solanum verrucosum]|uniref:Retrotransposon gag domain-containing protein n=1 Tax=Solanum verrucosum TaxID=315347 RepID=A0AAF0ZQI2_SOLVR|nr:hypothetical protein MTR67_039275 [Solanum verrucosum]
MAQSNREVVTTVKTNVAMTSTRVRDFTRMNPPEFYDCKVEEDHQEFIEEMRGSKVLDFINLRQGNMSVKEYALRFTQLSKYAPSILADRRTKMSKFVCMPKNLRKKSSRNDLERQTGQEWIMATSHILGPQGR